MPGRDEREYVCLGVAQQLYIDDPSSSKEYSHVLECSIHRSIIDINMAPAQDIPYSETTTMYCKVIATCSQKEYSYSETCDLMSRESIL